MLAKSLGLCALLGGLATSSSVLGCATGASIHPEVARRWDAGTSREQPIAGAPELGSASQGDASPGSEKGETASKQSQGTSPRPDRAANQAGPDLVAEYTPKQWQTAAGTKPFLANAPPSQGSIPPRVAPAFPERTASEALDQLGPAVTVRRERRGAVITLASDDLFAPGGWALANGTHAHLDDLARALQQQYGHSIAVQGYTDSLGTRSANGALSQRRAEAVREYLVMAGVPSDQIQAFGPGAQRPTSDNLSPEGRAQNRRIEIVIAP